jgi:centromeric protein E
MVGEDHSVSTALKEKDAEIAELRARLDDKDRMLAALRSAARSRDVAEASTEPRLPRPTPQPNAAALEQTTMVPASESEEKSAKGVDEMNRMLDEMIQDRVETGQIIRGVRGSVRLPPSARDHARSKPVVVEDVTKRDIGELPKDTTWKAEVDVVS